MRAPFIVSFLGPLSLTTASPVSQPRGTERSHSGIAWGPCNKTDFSAQEVASVPTSIQCATFIVPLDYKDRKDGGKMDLPLVKITAPKKPRDGQTRSILFNFGGPGVEARHQLPRFAKLLQAETGGIYDFVAFDPRGTGKTIPFTCESDPFTNYLQTASFGDILNDNSTQWLGHLWASAELTANKCAEQHRRTHTGDKISTVAVARDMMSVVDALQEDGLLRYWGMSYGSVIGAVLLAMFPQRMDKVVLDGVLNPHQYYNHLVNSEQWADLDKELTSIFPACVKNRDFCPLAKRSPKATAQNLEDQFWKLLDRIRREPLVYGSELIDQVTIKTLLLQSSYNYDNKTLADLTTKLALYLDLAEHKEVPPPPPNQHKPGKDEIVAQGSSEDADYGIQCLDRNRRLPPNASLEDFLPAAKELSGVSRTCGEASLFYSMLCAKWKLDPPEKFNSDFKVKPRKPVLMLSNTFDGHTPLISAYNLSSTIENSAVVRTDAHAHTSLRAPSSCLFHAVSDYWVQGKTPKNDTHCTTDAPLFSNTTWDDLLAKIAKGESKRSIPLDSNL